MFAAAAERRGGHEPGGPRPRDLRRTLRHLQQRYRQPQTPSRERRPAKQRPSLQVREDLNIYLWKLL